MDPIAAFFNRLEAEEQRGPTSRHQPVAFQRQAHRLQGLRLAHVQRRKSIAERRNVDLTRIGVGFWHGAQPITTAAQGLGSRSAPLLRTFGAASTWASSLRSTSPRSSACFAACRRRSGDNPSASTVVERPLDRRDRDWAEPAPVFLRNVREVEDESSEPSEATPWPRDGDREVERLGHRVGEAVRGERRLVREGARRPRPPVSSRTGPPELSPPRSGGPSRGDSARASSRTNRQRGFSSVQDGRVHEGSAPVQSRACGWLEPFRP